METSIIPGYAPLDLNEVAKAVPKGFKKITSEKDLETEVHDISNILKDLSKYQTLYD